MAQLFGLSAEQVDGIRFFPRNGVGSGWMTGIEWHHPCHAEGAALGGCPAADGPHTTLYNRCRRW